MKTLLFIFFLLSCCMGVAQQKDTVYVSSFGATPFSYENNVTKIQAAIDECRRSKSHVLVFEQGRYDIWPEGATRREYFISNTSTEDECPSKVKTVGLLFQDIDGLTILGNEATLMYHGKMTTIVFEHCRNMKICDLDVDFERPAGSELTYTKVGDEEVEVAVHRDSRYEIVNGRMNLYGEGWRSNRNHCIEYDPEKETFVHSRGWNILEGAVAKEISPGIVHFMTPKGFLPKVGNTLTIRDIIRDQVGMLLLESENITLSKLRMRYMHGLGIVSQYTKDITMDHVSCRPSEERGRLLAASADMMHFSGCSGRISISNCYYAGAQDDPINVHGTNLRAIERVDRRTLKLRFMHGQSYGFKAYSVGDTVAFVRAETMERFAQARVASTHKISDRVVEVSFDREIPKELEINADCVENLTATPEVDIRNCYFSRTSTRGTLMTTPRKVVIENNTYYKTGMSAILIEGDTEGWFESGPVSDVLIKGNTFVDCGFNGGPGNAIIALNPSNKIVDARRPVHKNIRIENNVFKTYDYPVLYAKSTSGLQFRNNTIVRTQTMPPLSENQSTFYLNGCKDVVIQGTNYEGYIPQQLLKTENMKSAYLKLIK